MSWADCSFRRKVIGCRHTDKDCCYLLYVTIKGKPWYQSARMFLSSTVTTEPTGETSMKLCTYITPLEITSSVADNTNLATMQTTGTLTFCMEADFRRICNFWYLTYTTVRTPSWKADSSSACKENTLCFLEIEGSAPRSQNHTITSYWIKFTQLYTIYLKFILILFYHLRLGLLSGLLLSGFPTTILSAFLVSPTLLPISFLFI